MNTSSSSISSASVRNILTLLISRDAQLVAGGEGLERRVTWAIHMRAGIQGICDHLARSSDKWVVLQDADQQVRFQSSPSGSKTPALPATLTDEALRHRDLTRIMVPVQIRHEVVGYLSLIGEGGDFDYLERLILGQVAPILALEFARERERSEVESRYSAEALMDVLQGNYQQPDEMVARARLLGYDLAKPQVVVIF